MPTFVHDNANLYYEVHGHATDAFPVLLFAPGGLRSAIPLWYRSPWNPIEALSGQFKVIAMDQRNAGHSVAPIAGDDGWHTYTADHLALLDHLNIDRCHLLGGCIGGPYCFGLIEAAPDRIAAAVIQQTIGNDGTNAAVFRDLFNDWAEENKALHPETSDDDWASFGRQMFGGDFVYNVSRDFLQACPTPLLVLMGRDAYHPEATSREIARLAPNAVLVEHWQDPEVVGETPRLVRDFLGAHTP